MTNWNKKTIKRQIDYLNDIKFDDPIKKEELSILKNMKKPSSLKRKQKEIMQTEAIEYEKFKNIEDLINSIIEKYNNKDITIYPYHNIYTREKDMLNFVKEMLKRTNPDWLENIEFYLNNKDFININNNNENFTIFLRYIHQIYVSLNMENTIEDFITPIHEFMHVNTIVMNPNFYFTIENEIPSILMQLITSYEMKEMHLHYRENVKAELNYFNYIKELINRLNTRLTLIKKTIPNNIKLGYYYYNGYNNKEIKTLYNYDITTMLSTVIAYFIAIELFEIYKNDKQACIDLIEYIIKGDENLKNKLNNIQLKPLTNDDSYIKQLKKEYIISSQ